MMTQNSTVTSQHFDCDLHTHNRNLATAEMLAPYENQWIAWSLDGTTILGHDPDFGQLCRRLDQQGLPSDGYVLSYHEPIE